MSRPLIRQRPPADDDVKTATEDELRERLHAEAKTETHGAVTAKNTEDSGAAPIAHGIHSGAREQYFAGRYANPADSKTGLLSAEAIVNQRATQFGLPASLRACLLELIHVLRHKGIAEAFAALYRDANIDRKYHEPVRSLLAAIERDDESARR
jgi:hypothetical protein